MKQIVGGLVAGFLIMLWQTLSHTALNLHAEQERYAPDNAIILENLENHLPGEGMYFLPGMPPGTTMDEYEKKQKEWQGKPWALIQYHKGFNTNMGANILRGLLTNLILGLALVWVLAKMKNSRFFTVLFATIAIGFISFCFQPYPGFIWYKTPGIWIELLDTVVAFGLAGVWLGWWMQRAKKRM